MNEYRVIMQHKNKQGDFINDEVIMSGEIKDPETILDLGLRHLEQITILQKVQDHILYKQSIFLKEDISNCPKCGKPLRKNGFTKSTFNAVLTDHKIPVQRLLCGTCKWSSIPSVHSLLGTHMHPDLIKLQCEESSRQSYSKAKNSLNRQSGNRRTVNSTMTLHGVVEQVGNYMSNYPQKVSTEVEPAKELIVQADGGHIKTKDKDSRSFEALTAIVYKPENIVRNEKTNRGTITQKHCVASALDDDQKQIKKQTLVAAKSEGMTKDTDVVAICDGAQNCWNIIDSLSEECYSITRILDWFHITMKFQNLGSFKSNQEDDLLSSAKWSLWHGNTELFYERLDSLIEKVSDSKKLKKLKALRKYINNNARKIVDYSKRKDSGLLFTSNVAECTVESLINERCKGKSHMQWSRDGVQSILQIRAATASNDWDENWEQYILGSIQKAA